MKGLRWQTESQIHTMNGIGQGLEDRRGTGRGDSKRNNLVETRKIMNKGKRKIKIKIENSESRLSDRGRNVD